jgi:putative ABC transport system ATP-binding protein
MLKVENLCKVFNKNTVNENTLFHGLNLTVEEGDFVTIIGSNGAGKSSLLNIIAGSLDEDEGSISLNGKELSHIPEYKRAGSIGRVFQDPSKGTAPGMTILENLSMAFNKGKSFGLTPGINKKNTGMFKELLSKLNLGLEDKLYTKVGLLSGGQRQALSLISVLMSKPQLLLLDEHTAALDPKTSERIIKITENVVNENKTTTLMVTHNLNHAVKLGNRLIMMHRGKVALDLSGEEKKSLTTEKLLKCFDSLQDKEFLSDRMLFS